jgi:hypothetical protein
VHFRMTLVIARITGSPSVSHVRPFCTPSSIQLEEDRVHFLILSCLFREAKVKFRKRNESNREG